MGSAGSHPAPEGSNGSETTRAPDSLPGDTISHYRIIERLGEGGLGTVYKAEDTAAKRIVAHRILARNLIAHEESKRRFLDEAASARELIHPNICAVYEAADTGDNVFMAVEYLDGTTLEELLRRHGPLHSDDAVDVARQVAVALQVGFDRGIVHRGIKPSNIFLLQRGAGDPLVKVADFGLGYLSGQSKLNRNGASGKSLAYISPEQTQWTTTDHRTDIWSLGVVLYEMVTGRRPFRGQDGAAIIRSVLNDRFEPASKIRASLPPRLDEVIAKCLAKDPDQRYQMAAELADALEELKPITISEAAPAPAEIAGDDLPEGEPVPEVEIVDQVAAEPPSRSAPPMELALPPWKQYALHRPGREKFWKRLTGLAFAAALGIAAFHFLSRPDPRLRKYSFALPGVEVPEGRAAISPDGRYLAYVAGSGPPKLFVQDLREDAPREIDGSAGASRPFWSPDSEWIGFLAGGEIKKAPLQGGAVKTVCAVPHTSDHFSASWSPDGKTIVFSGDTPHRVFSVSAGGGYPDVILEPDAGQPPVTFARFLPGGSTTLLVASGADNSKAAVLDMRSGERRDLGIDAGYLTYSPTGHLLYHEDLFRSGPLWAVPFSASSGTVEGAPFQVRERAEWPTVSADGTLAYRDPGGPWVEQLTWRARNGDTIGTIARAWQHISQPTFSRDGRRILVAARDPSYSGIWVYDSAVNQWVQETSGEAAPFLAVSPFDDRFAFSASVDGALAVFAKIFQARGGAEARPLLQGPGDAKVTDWSRDGTQIVFHRKTADGPNDLWRMAVQFSASEPVALVRSPNDERDAALSRDGRFVAYVSNRSGAADIYLAPFPAGGPETRVSREGGTQPRWSPSGDELFFVDGDNLMSVTVTAGPAVAVSKPQPLFSDPGLAMAAEPGERRYDVSPDGQRFIVATPSLEPGGTPAAIRVAENWFEEFR